MPASLAESSKRDRWKPHPNDPLQEGEGLVDGGVRVEAVLAVLELVVQDDFEALREAVRLFLQPDLLLMQSKGVLLQLLILPALCSKSGTWQVRYTDELQKACLLLWDH